MNHPTPRTRRGFTLVELIVAVSIVTLMLVLVNQIFNDTGRAVSQGIELSEVISSERAMQDFLQRDASQMIGPAGPPGATAIAGDATNGAPLVIVQHQTADMDFPVPGTSLNENLTRPVRADQLMFVRQRGTELPTTPAGNSEFTSGSLGTETQYVRVWYGHALRTNEDGTDPGLTADLDATPVFLDDGKPTSWILGRQGLFLVGDPATGAPTLPANHANGGWVDAPVTGIAAPDTDLYNGVTDVAYFSLLKSNQSPFGSMVADTAGGTPPSNNAGRVLAADLPAANYRNLAVREYTFARYRLRVNDRPPAETYNAWEIAQMHAIMAEGVSDFIVEFAADTNNDGEIDRVSSAESLTLFGNNNFTGSVKWYTHDAYVNRPAFVLPPTMLSSPGPDYDPNKPLTFELPNVAPFDFYRNSVHQPALGPNINAGTAAFVWRHDRFNPTADPTAAVPVALAPPPANDCDWPYLLRVRYRFHDGRGRLASSEGRQGVWFEQVLRVNRPFPAPTP